MSDWSDCPDLERDAQVSHPKKIGKGAGFSVPALQSPRSQA